MPSPALSSSYRSLLSRSSSAAAAPYSSVFLTGSYVRPRLPTAVGSALQLRLINRTSHIITHRVSNSTTSTDSPAKFTTSVASAPRSGSATATAGSTSNPLRKPSHRPAPRCEMHLATEATSTLAANNAVESPASSSANAAGPGSAVTAAGGSFGAVAASTAGAASSESAAALSAFFAGLMPKEEIGATRFLQSHPHADGRGVVVAIFDSGVDPGAPGLQVTSDGRPKFIDVVDCTGSGDVDTSVVVKVDANGFIAGASGARLQINPSWSNPSGAWHVGCTRLFGLFSETVMERVMKDRRKPWDSRQQVLVTEALRQMAAFELHHNSSKCDSVKKEREELQARLDLLQSMQESYEDMGPLIDAVVWHDGATWRAALDTSDIYADMEADVGGAKEGASASSASAISSAAAPGSRGKLADFIPMTNFRLERQRSTFSPLDACGFVLNIFDSGRVLSIVTDANAHGTHVAGIVAACHPESPALNGLAPGAQLVSCKIGDTRLGSMETAQGLVRAIIVAQQNNCDVINMSYGEPVAQPNYGRFIDVANQIVNKYGICFVSSAGNEGPALSSVTAPGGTSSSLIGVGAYVSPGMAAAAHLALDEMADGQQYTWSSRGPTTDGHSGVSVSAPGGAMAPVPTALLQARMTMAGTSMAAPNCAGGVAVIVSALKHDHGISRVSPHVLRRAMENTAADVAAATGGDASLALTHGRGMLQVDRAYEYLSLLPPASLSLHGDVRYSVMVKAASGAGTNKRGIYIREPKEGLAPSEWQVFIDPWFHDDVDNLSVKAAFEKTLRLETTAAWVKAPEMLLLPNNGRNFFVRVDPTSLPPGLHYAEITATDAQAAAAAAGGAVGCESGVLFRVPVTLIKPQDCEDAALPMKFSFGQLQPGKVQRTFLSVPHGATWAEIHLQLSDFSVPTTVVLHTMQLLPSSRTTYRRSRSFLQFSAPSSKPLNCLVEGGTTMEVAVGLSWSSGRGEETKPKAEMEVSFHGLSPLRGDVTIHGGSNVQRVDVVAAPFRMERCNPTITINRLRSAHRPSDSKIEPLSVERDMLPDGRQIQALTLTYKFSVTEPGRFTPRFPLLNHRLYDSETEGHFFILFDAHKRQLACEDAYPKAVKLGKGEYTLRVQLRQDRVAALEKLRNMPLLLDRALEDKSSLKLSLYNSADAAIFAGADTVKSALMAPNEKRAFFISGPGDLPKDAVPGTTLLGRMTVAKVGGLFATSDATSAAPCRVHVTYIVPPPNNKPDDKKSSSSTPPTKTTADRLKEEIRDAKLKVLSSLASEDKQKNESEFVSLAEMIKDEHPTHLPLLLEVLRFYDDAKMRNQSLSKVVDSADAIIASIDRTALAVFCAMKSESEGADAAKEKKDREAERDALIEALHKKALALADREKPTAADTTSATEGSDAAAITEPPTPMAVDSTTAAAAAAAPPAAESTAADDEFELTFQELRKWADTSASKFGMLCVTRERRAKRPASALKILNRVLDDDPKLSDKKTLELRVALLEELQWSTWARHEKRWNVVRFPAAYAPF